MTTAGESEWGDERSREKKGVPRWLWWTCGSGCLILLLVAATAAVLFGGFVKKAMDPEQAWADVQEILPYDQRPEGWDARGTSLFGYGQYMLQPPEPRGAMVMIQRLRSPPDLDAMLDPGSAQNRGILGINEIRDPESGTIEVQGRETRCLRFKAWIPGPEEGSEGSGTSIRIDVTGAGKPALVQITLMREPDRVSDELVATLLAPFDVWRGR